MMNRRIISGMISFTLAAYLFVSCEKERPLSEAITGKWEVQTIQQVYLLQNVKKFETTFFLEAGELSYEYTSGGSIIMYEGSNIYGPLNYTISGNKVIIETTDKDIELKNVSIDGNTLMWTETGTDIIDEITYNVEINYTAVKD